MIGHAEKAADGHNKTQNRMIDLNIRNIYADIPKNPNYLIFSKKMPYNVRVAPMVGLHYILTCSTEEFTDDYTFIFI